MNTRLSKLALFSALTLISGGVWLVLYLYYDKFNAEWFGINVIYVSAMAAFLTGIVIVRFRWFQNRFLSTPMKMYIILIGGFLLSTFLGIYLTEPVSRVNMSDEEVQFYQYSRSRAGGYYLYYFGDTVDLGANIAADVADTDLDGEAVVILFLTVLVLVLIFASAVIPHFWVLAGVVLITVMGTLLYKDVTREGNLTFGDP